VVGLGDFHFGVMTMSQYSAQHVPLLCNAHRARNTR
jgi:hypothetical protein